MFTYNYGSLNNLVDLLMQTKTTIGWDNLISIIFNMTNTVIGIDIWMLINEDILSRHASVLLTSVLQNKWFTRSSEYKGIYKRTYINHSVRITSWGEFFRDLPNIVRLFFCPFLHNTGQVPKENISSNSYLWVRRYWMLAIH
jgi:hypothetical protein